MKVVEMKPRRNGRPAPANDRSTVVHLRLPASLVQRLKQNAAANFRTMTQEVHLRLKRDLEDNK